MNLYAYCLSRALSPPSLESIVGVADGKPYLIQYEEIMAVVSDYAGESVSISRDNVFAHERVIDHVLAQTTPLPFRFGTVVAPERLDTYIHSQQGALLANLARVAGCVEMSVKIIWDPETTKDAMRNAEKEHLESGFTKEAMGPGTAFLAAKRLQLVGDETLKQQAEELAQWLAHAVSDVVQDSVVQVKPTEALVIAAAHLIARTNLDEYQSRLKLIREARPDLHFLSSGPWPPYSFSNLGAS